MKMKLVSFFILLTFVLAFTGFNILATPSTTESSISIIQDQIVGFQPEEINFAFLVEEVPELTENNFTHFLTVLEDTLGESETITSITSLNLANKQVIVIVSPESNFTENEIAEIETFIENGKSVLYMTGADNLSKVSQKFFDDFFGTSLISIDEQLLSNDTVVTTQFASPRIPAIEDINKLIFPKSVGLTINSSAQTNRSLKDIYPLVIDSLTGKALALAVEFDSNARIVITGSNLLFSDGVLDTNSISYNISGQTNELFAKNVMLWLGRGTGYFTKQEHTISTVSLAHVGRNELISATANITDHAKRPVKNAEVFLTFETGLTIFSSVYMTFEVTGELSGVLFTNNIPDGQWYDIEVKISKRGYIDQTFTLGRIFVNPIIIDPTLPSFVMIFIALGGIIIFFSTFILSWKEIGKIGDLSEDE